MEVSALVDPSPDAFGVEAEAPQPFEVVLRDEAAVGDHVPELLVREGETPQFGEGAAQLGDEGFVVDGFIAVVEDERPFGLREELEVGV